METVFNKESVQYGIMVSLEVIHCYKCAIPFAVPVDYKQRLRDTGEEFFCPNGHGQVYTKTTVMKLQEQIEREQEKIKHLNNSLDFVKTQRDSAERRIVGQKIQVSKLKNRIKNGVCPCCNRTFQNLHNHMKTQHPDYNHHSPEQS